MKKSVSKFGILIVVLSILFISSVPPVSRAQIYELEVGIIDTTAYPGEQTTITIQLKNYSDTVAAFEFWLLMEHPEIAEFVTQSETINDTTYRIGTVDTSGTLCSGWEQLSAVSIGGQGHDLKVTGMADIFEPPLFFGIAPQNGDMPLIKIPIQVYDIPDEQTDRSVGIYFQADNLDHFAFSDPRGNSLGVDTNSVPDTSWFNCLYWDGDTICLFWEEVPNGPADSMWCCDTIKYTILSPDIINVSHGTLMVEGPPACGDYNGDGNINIIDITGIISYLYMGGQPPAFPNSIDVNSSGNINLLDITYLINYLYGQGPEPNCP